MTDPEGRRVGATFLRNNLNKRSICVDLKSPEGRQLVLLSIESLVAWPRVLKRLWPHAAQVPVAPTAGRPI